MTSLEFTGISQLYIGIQCYRVRLDDLIIRFYVSFSNTQANRQTDRFLVLLCSSSSCWHIMTFFLFLLMTLPTSPVFSHDKSCSNNQCYSFHFILNYFHFFFLLKENLIFILKNGNILFLQRHCIYLWKSNV